MTKWTGTCRKMLSLSTATIAIAATPAFAQQETTPAIVINDNFTPGEAVDTDDVNGVGQIVTNAGGGSVGLCTGTLINPRMFLFAAHCVNSRPAASYGSDGTQIGVGFQADTLQSIRNWFGSGFSTSTTDFFYNVNHVAYNAASLRPGPTLNFLESDIAIATLDTPAANVPTWTMLFSPLPTPDSIDLVNGTGYHVTVTGYGRNGTGTTGSSNGIDFRRRVAENTLGILGSLDDVDTFLFGQPSGFPQNLYMIDFDDPARGTNRANRFDFNVFRDAPLPGEGSTAPGDSGGPLIIDQAFGPDVKTVIGVLSGGSRYFNAQPGGSYGTSSFYQPLYLFWDYIAANNPYHYVSAAAGDGNWTDPTHWVSQLDPSYQVIGANGGLVNGIPGDVGEGANGTDPKFGQICFQQPGVNECVDLSTGESIVDDQPVPITDENPQTGGFANNISGGYTEVSLNDVLLSASSETIVGLQEAAADTQAPLAVTAAIPVPTLANGLPGASGFVPQNFDGDRATNARPSYFDVTLSQAGTTTLDTDITIDRITLAGSSTALNITQGGGLLSLIDATQFGGRLNVDGTFATIGDYALIAGLLSGDGLVLTPFLTNVAGVIAPGDLGTAGTLTIAGNLILSSGSTLAIDLGGANASDLLNIRTIGGSDGTGQADLGGNLIFTAVPGFRPRFGDSTTFLQAEGGITGRFAAGSELSAILFPQLTYTENSVSVQILARDFADVVDPASGIQTGFAQLLDQNRPNFGNLSGIYGELDLLQLDELRANLELLAPFTEATRTSLVRMPTESLARLYRDRVQLARTGEAGGTLAMIGQPLAMAARTSNTVQMNYDDAAQGRTTISDVRLPQNVSAFIAGGYLNGDAAPLPSAIATGRDELDGWFAAIGGEVSPTPGTVVGASLAYSNTDGNAAFGQRADGELYQGAIYGAYTSAGGIMVSGQLSAGVFESDTSRDILLGASPSSLQQGDSSMAVGVEANVGKDFGKPDGLVFTPNVGLRYEFLGFDRSKERGGDGALAFNRDSYESLQGRAGLALGGSLGAIKPRVTATYVHDFLDQPETFGANFVGGIGPDARFALPTTDGDWGEIGAAVRFGSGNVSVDIAADTTIERSDLDYQTYRATLNIQF